MDTSFAADTYVMLRAIGGILHKINLPVFSLRGWAPRPISCRISEG
jgi:hypothetical protein